MSQLIDYIIQHTSMGPAGENPDAANMVFFDVTTSAEATGEKLRELLVSSSDRFPTTMLLAGAEHSYIEIGGWLGSQQLALRLMGMGVVLKMWALLSPRTMLSSDVPAETEREMAEFGLLSVQTRVAREGHSVADVRS